MERFHVGRWKRKGAALLGSLRLWKGTAESVIHSVLCRIAKGSGGKGGDGDGASAVKRMGTALGYLFGREEPFCLLAPVINPFSGWLD